MAVRAFISYAWDDAAHVEMVRRFRDFLRDECGIDARLDLSAGERPQDWPAWIQKQIRKSDYILVAVSSAYKRRADDRAAVDEGRGVRWESRLLRELCYANHKVGLAKVLPIVLPGQSSADIPFWLGPTTRSYYVVSDFTLAGAAGLVRYLTGSSSGSIASTTNGRGLQAGRVGARSVEQWAESEAGRRLRSYRIVSKHVQGFGALVGRDGELRELALDLAANKDPGRPTMRVLTGLGGVGKTSLARAYAATRQPDYGLVWWVRCEDLAAVPAEFRALLEVLMPDSAREVTDPVQAIHAVLANREEPWLLVLDNVQEPSDLSGLVPPAGQGHVLVTSRSGVWPVGAGIHRISVLDKYSAMRLLHGPDGECDNAAASALAEELGRLPLALAQAASYVAAQPDLDLAGYLDLYRRRRAEMHCEGRAPDYEGTVATTWQLAFDRLSEPARAVLNLICWYAPEAIPLRLLLTPADARTVTLPSSLSDVVGPLLGDEIHSRRALADLTAYSLITTSGAFRGAVDVHRLVQAVTRDRLSRVEAAQDWASAAAALLVSASPPWPPNLTRLTVWHQLRTHVWQTTDHLSPDTPTALALRRELGDWSGRSGDAATASQLFADLIDHHTRVLGRDHRHTLAARAEHAYWTGEAGGDPAEVRDMYAAVATDRERVLGRDDRDTLTARAELAYYTGAAGGDPAKVRDMYAAVATDRERALGREDRDTLNARAQTAYYTGAAGGDPAEVRDMYAAVAADRERILGPDDRHTVVARFQTAHWAAEAGGDPAGVLALHAEVAADCERALGADDHETLRVRSRLAFHTGRAKRAPTLVRDLYAALAIDCERVLGLHHPDTLAARADHAYWTEQATKVEHCT
jgi:hypothetical protein